ncbi:MAG: hypothetical protein ACRBBO_07905 [Cognatishimia sp.]|uniref:hypothetical protein n=1 Tax=Cognatishimia sp. 1_MG-2023 TaxID=3062642 RepID=UPI0026E4397C|nr:hypothetical protein [Cognatishimia sp. 1_MG-2023]MDO6726290.1 hypothetical protein [Cognatishimia sp. 1_MG-2023]
MTRHSQPAPDYTTAALVMGFVNLMWIFTAIWALWGLVPVFLLALFLNTGISRLAT